MGVWAVVLLVLLAVVLLVAASVLLPVRFRLDATFADGRFRYRGKVRLPLFPWYFTLPTFPVRQPERPAEIKRSRVPAFRRVLGAARHRFPEIAALTSRVARSVTVLDFRLKAWVGTGEAADTALLAGGLQAVAGIVTASACRKGIRFKRCPQVRIRPVYDRAVVAGEVHLHLSLAPARLILAALRLLRGGRDSEGLALALSSRRVKPGKVEY